MEYQLITRQQAIEILRWLLYSVLFIFSMMVESIIYPQITIGGITMCAIPVCIACIAVREGAESSCVFAMCAGAFYALSGVNMGALYVVTLTLSAVLSGGICDHHFNRNIVSAIILSLMSLFICQVPAFLLRLYESTSFTIYFSDWQTVLLPEILYSLIAVPVFYLLTWPAYKVGR